MLPAGTLCIIYGPVNSEWTLQDFSKRAIKHHRGNVRFSLIFFSLDSGRINVTGIVCTHEKVSQMFHRKFYHKSRDRFTCIPWIYGSCKITKEAMIVVQRGYYQTFTLLQRLPCSLSTPPFSKKSLKYEVSTRSMDRDPSSHIIQPTSQSRRNPWKLEDKEQRKIYL